MGLAKYWDRLSHTGAPVGGAPPGPASHSTMCMAVSLGRSVLAGTDTVMGWPLEKGVPAVNGACEIAALIC